MQKLDDSIIGKYENFLLYGEGGTGKTFASGTMPAPVYHLIAGSRGELVTLRSPDFLKMHPKIFDEQYYDVIFETVGKRGIFVQADAYDLACDTLDNAMAEDAKGDMPFKSIVIDATGLAEFAMNKSIEITYETAGSKEKTALKKLIDSNIIVPSDQDYKGEQSLMTKYVAWALRMDKHVCVITHEWREEHTDRKTRVKTLTNVRPQFTGKNRKEIPRLFSNVWRFTTSGKGEGQVYEVQTVRDEIIYAKTRFGGLLSGQLRNVDLSVIVEKYKAEVARRAA